MARKAVLICNACVVRETCLEENRDVPDGIFGGQSARKRQRKWLGLPVEKVCVACDVVYQAKPESRSNTCSRKCWIDHYRRRQRGHYEKRTGKQLDHEPSRARYNAGCRCSACREAERVYRREIRARQDDVA